MTFQKVLLESWVRAFAGHFVMVRAFTRFFAVVRAFAGHFAVVCAFTGLFTVVWGPFAWAGHEGHGASPIGQALHRAQRETLPNLFKVLRADHPELVKSQRLKTVFRQHFENFRLDLLKLQLEQTAAELSDISGGYKTWIALSQDRTRIYYNSKAYETSDAKKSGVKIQSIAMEQLLHELGHYYGLDEDDAWEFARTLIFAYQKSALESKPELLAEVKSQQHRSGLSWEEVQRFCDSQKKIYERIYFYVYCDLVDKTWSEEVRSTVYVEESRFVGYRWSKGSIDEWVGLWLRLPGVQSEAGYRSSSKYFEISPVTEKFSVPRTVTQTVRRDLYDIKVFGVGRIESLSSKVLLDSAAFYEGAVPVYYDSKAQARLSCLQNLQQLQVTTTEGWRYDRASCEAYALGESAPSSPDQKFSYRIKTLNPFILD